MGKHGHRAGVPDGHRLVLISHPRDPRAGLLRHDREGVRGVEVDHGRFVDDDPVPVTERERPPVLERVGAARLPGLFGEA